MSWPHINRSGFDTEGLTAGWDVEVRVDQLSGAALDCAYELARYHDTRELQLCPKGLLIALNDDANPPGWYYYAPRYETRDEAIVVIRDRFGDTVRVPIESTRIANPTHTRFTKS